MSATRLLSFCVAFSMAWAGPVDFGKQEFARALEERKLPAARFRIQTEVSTDAPESFRIVGARISGGDLRGLMYGLLEAAEQIRSTGRLVAAKGSATTHVRGVRIPVSAEALSRRTYWEELLAEMARSRLNRLNLAIQGIAAFDARSLEALRLISEAASTYAVDLVLSVPPDVELKEVLAGCPAVRSVEITGVAQGRLEMVRVIRDAGRRVVIEIPHQDLTASILDKVTEMSVPWLVSAAYKGQPAPATAAPEGLVWRLSAPVQSSDPATIRKVLQELTQPGVAGFEIDAPAMASVEAHRRLWMEWGRLSYNPKAPQAAPGSKAAMKK